MTSFKDIQTKIQHVLETSLSEGEVIKFPVRKRNNPSELPIKRINFSGYPEYCEKPILVYRAENDKDYDYFLYVGNKKNRVFSVIVLYKKHHFSGEFAYLIEGVQLTPDEARQLVVERLLTPSKKNKPTK